MDTLIRLLLMGAAIYATVGLAAYLLQERLIFYPTPVWQEPGGSDVTPVMLNRGQITLHGWVVKPDSTGPVIIYFGGNAEELSYLTTVFTRLEATTLLINYRGYGNSEGRPTAADLIDDAKALVTDLPQQFGKNRPLILIGRSLGSGIAAAAAATAEVDGLVLLSPYRSLVNLGQRAMPWLPVRWLMRHEIDVTAMLDGFPERVLVLYSPEDRVVPQEESRALVGLLSQAPKVIEFGGGHNVPLTHPGIWRAVVEFVNDVGGAD